MVVNFETREKGDNTILKATLIYDMKNSLFDVMNVLMVKRMNTKLWNSVVAGHKKYIETGERVTEKTALDLNAVIEVKG